MQDDYDLIYKKSTTISSAFHFKDFCNHQYIRSFADTYLNRPSDDSMHINKIIMKATRLKNEILIVPFITFNTTVVKVKPHYLEMCCF